MFRPGWFVGDDGIGRKIIFLGHIVLVDQLAEQNDSMRKVITTDQEQKISIRKIKSKTGVVIKTQSLTI